MYAAIEVASTAFPSSGMPGSGPPLPCRRSRPTPSCWGETMIYQVRVEGQLGPQWADWFEGLAITQEEDGDTLLTGPIVDQATLHGLL